MMFFVIILVSLLLLTALFGALYFLALRSGKRMKHRLREKFGPRLKLASGCGVISGYNRVPGVIGLLDDRIIFQAMITAEKGEILFHDIRSWLMENTGSSRYRRARKYRAARVLALAVEDGPVRLFILSDKTAPRWERNLSLSLGAPDQSQTTGGP